MSTQSTPSLGGEVILTPPQNANQPRTSVGKYWVFTYFPEETELPKIIDIVSTHFRSEKCAYSIGLETCPTTKRKHLQGYVEHPLRIRPMEKFRGILPGAHWEKAQGNRASNLKYTQKEGHYVTNIRDVFFFQDPLDSLDLYPFQEIIIDWMTKTPPDYRTIYWVYCEKGNTGKTSLAKHLCHKHGAIFVNGKAEDVKYSVSEYVKQNEGHGPPIIVFGIPRYNENYINYGVIEEVKDGIFFSPKYESGMCMYNALHILVLCNFPPDRSKLSDDRWFVCRIDEESKNLIEE